MASAEERLDDLKAQRSRLQSKITARTGQPGYSGNVEAMRAQLSDVDTQITATEAEIAAQAEEQTDGEQPGDGGLQ